jgi:hypothetical protein
MELLEHLVNAAQNSIAALLKRSAVQYHDINAGDSTVFVVGSNPRQWQPLPDDAQPLVGAARSAHDQLRDFAELAFTVGAPERANKVGKLCTWLLRLIEQPNGSLPRGAPGPSIEAITNKLDERLDGFMTEATRLPTAHGQDERLLVADTSALLDRPDLQNWKLDGAAWTVVLTPQVLAELDDRKRDVRTAAAAQKVIRQIDEFDRRGDTFAGVPLARKLKLREVAVSPDMGRTLPWLRADTPDDVVVAGALELVVADLRARVAVLASDRNMRNKARLAGLSTFATTQL